MPKVKTHSGAKKRFKKTANGLFKAGRPFKRHLLTKKSSKRKRALRKGLYISNEMVRHIRASMPY
jgi:large subunit ribosomal protein L35